MNASLKEKIILLLFSGVALGFAYTPRQYRRILQITGREWSKINKENLKKEIRNLYRSKLIREKKNSDGSFTFILSEKGKLKALTYHFDNIQIDRKKWDGKWRAVIFDIPEKLKSGRNALRDKLKELGFYEFQKSVFVFPHKCEDEINFIIEFFGLRRYVRYGIFDYVDNDLHLRKNFNLK